MPDVPRLARILRVRTLQLGLVRADEAQARDKAAGEVLLQARIAQLSASVAPAAAPLAGVALVAAAHFRERLHASAEAAEHRARAAQAQVERAAEATRAARRDQHAIEKLIARADTAAAVRGIRALEVAPPSRPNRHDPC